MQPTSNISVQKLNKFKTCLGVVVDAGAVGPGARPKSRARSRSGGREAEKVSDVAFGKKLTEKPRVIEKIDYARARKT